ncbi:uncharacterized protein SPSK_05739 [Sporothrix schenckii 1099-18]|uniref:Uncharacterized protein n=1 Tax=Sporothrix schenckii 1099-18 TaxID=1397361 RepID=A0A0F2LS57_SPOSC|nr:uncharacterized protein SPSK_05739 [Sporothrix schenckii 1099-18]KJR80353.1 hypothetical protein SPSK_05739 [Sporothrix schenckii 1099-18]
MYDVAQVGGERGKRWRWWQQDVIVVVLELPSSWSDGGWSRVRKEQLTKECARKRRGAGGSGFWLAVAGELEWTRT